MTFEKCPKCGRQMVGVASDMTSSTKISWKCSHCEGVADSNSKPTFDYIQVNVIGAIKTLKELHENLLIGGFSCATVEFLGRCLNGYQSTSEYDNFHAFVERFLKKQNSNYDKYKYLLWKDMRNGAAHSMMPKNFCPLSFDKRTEKFHLQIIQDVNTNKYYLQIYTPQFLEDLERAVMDFISEAQRDSQIQKNYMEILEQISKENEDIFKKSVSEEDRKNAIKVSINGDIRF